MEPRRLRVVVSIGAVALTAGVAAVVATDPLPGPPSSVTAAPVDPLARLAAREERAAELLDAAERRLRQSAGETPAANLGPQVAVAPAPAVPVTSSGSS